MKRIYESIIHEHLNNYSQMIFIVGPRQVGKTTLSQINYHKHTNSIYLNWDNIEHKQLILQGQLSVAKFAGIENLQKSKPIIIFDEIHKYKKWKSFLKGFFDTYKNNFHIIVTGSAKLNVYKAGGDSLMGRYFLYRIHPLTINEVITQKREIKEIVNPLIISDKKINRLMRFGGFPEPYIKENSRFYNKWKNLRRSQLFFEDIRDLTHVHEMSQMEILAEILNEQAACLTNYSALANKVNVTSKTVQKWIKILESMYFCFRLTPWTKNVTRSLLKEPKLFLWDWSLIQDPGKKFENFIASHLLKATHYWTDLGLGKYSVHFIRDKNKREVDFIVIKNDKPWFLVEAKVSSNASINQNLYYFQKKLNCPYAFQVVKDMQYIDKDCFTRKEPTKVPMITFLSQLV